MTILSAFCLKISKGFPVQIRQVADNIILWRFNIWNQRQPGLIDHGAASQSHSCILTDGGSLPGSIPLVAGIWLFTKGSFVIQSRAI